MTFAGTIPEIYDRYLGDALFDPFARRMVQGLGEYDLVLEIACGTGVATRRLMESRPYGASVVALDSSESMIGFAKQKLGHMTGLSLARADGEFLPFEDETFDVVVCAFGLMFFRNERRGLREMRRILRPGGFVRYTIWSGTAQNIWIEAVREAVADFFPKERADWYDAPFAPCDIDAQFDALHAAPFSEFRVTPIKLPLRRTDSKALATGFVQANPRVRAMIEAEGISPSEIEAKVAATLTERFGDPMRTTMRAFLFEARNQ
jgi:ubiquinone/menaquinone biosynthesis C-methylase UbiE